MPANRSRTMQWRRCLDQIRERSGAIEIAVGRPEGEADTEGRHLVWRVRVLALSETEILVEPPMALGQGIRLEAGVALVGAIAVGQNRWTFDTECLGEAGQVTRADGRSGGLRLRMPESVERRQRRAHERVPTAMLRLPEVEVWPLLDPRSVVLAERDNELQLEQERTGAARIGSRSPEDAGIMPEVGPKFTALMLNLGGGGLGLLVPPEHAQMLARHRLFWLRICLRPELSVPLCASAKLVHSHMQSDQAVYAGLAFDFTFNAPHQRVVANQICRFVLKQQLMQRESAGQAAPLRRSA